MFKKMIMFAAIAGLVFALAGGAAQATVLYSETFDTDVAGTATFNTTYPGFTSTDHFSLSVSGGVAQGFGYIYRTMPTYNFEFPLTFSADIGTNDSNTGQGLGLFLGQGQPAKGKGIALWLFHPSGPNGGRVGDSAGQVADNFSGGNQNIDPDVLGDGTLTTISLSIRQNASVAADFDWLVTVAGVEQFGGWDTDPKGTFFDGGLTSFGLTGDSGPTKFIDNMTLIPEPATMILLAVGLPLMLRRRRS